MLHYSYRATTVEFWQVRPQQWCPHCQCAAAAVTAFYSAESRQDLGLGGLAFCHSIQKVNQAITHITYMFSNGCFDKMFTFLPNWYERFLPIHLQCIGPNPQWVQVLSNVAQRSQILNSISISKLTWKEKERNYPSEIIPTLLWCSHCYAISHYLFSTLLPSTYIQSTIARIQTMHW